MSTPSDSQQQQPPPATVSQQAYTAHSGHGSVGPVIAVLAVIAILGVIAGMIGRLCSGRRVLGYGQYDVEGWIERKCSSCLNGRVGAPPAPAAAAGIEGSGGSAPALAAAEKSGEIQQEGQMPGHDPPVGEGS
ncbi:uncharacterized protein LOC131155512 [Malania oleifera]|uniref:uncharacterized protein LOC131155512 n=1 Tax=Malania oleifera TaxID=397392 RepID=UPI0025AE959F|nr:uncharacterized protein LOC131155512 [Malania oleifera]